MIEWSPSSAAKSYQEAVAEPATSCQVVRLYRLHINIHFWGTEGAEHVPNVQMLWYFFILHNQQEC